MAWLNVAWRLLSRCVFVPVGVIVSWLFFVFVFAVLVVLFFVLFCFVLFCIGFFLFMVVSVKWFLLLVFGLDDKSFFVACMTRDSRTYLTPASAVMLCFFLVHPFPRIFWFLCWCFVF